MDGVATPHTKLFKAIYILTFINGLLTNTFYVMTPTIIAFLNNKNLTGSIYFIFSLLISIVLPDVKFSFRNIFSNEISSSDLNNIQAYNLKKRKCIHFIKRILIPWLIIRYFSVVMGIYSLTIIYGSSNNFINIKSLSDIIGFTNDPTHLQIVYTNFLPIIIIIALFVICIILLFLFITYLLFFRVMIKVATYDYEYADENNVYFTKNTIYNIVLFISQYSKILGYTNNQNLFDSFLIAFAFSIGLYYCYAYCSILIERYDEDKKPCYYMGYLNDNILKTKLLFCIWTYQLIVNIFAIIFKKYLFYVDFILIIIIEIIMCIMNRYKYNNHNNHTVEIELADIKVIEQSSDTV